MIRHKNVIKIFITIIIHNNNLRKINFINSI